MPNGIALERGRKGVISVGAWVGSSTSDVQRKEHSMRKERVPYEAIVEKAKEVATMRDLSLVLGISERVLRRRFQRQGTTFTSIKQKSFPARSAQRSSAFLEDLRRGDFQAIALNRQCKELKVKRNKLLIRKSEGWQEEVERLGLLIQEYEDLLKEW